MGVFDHWMRGIANACLCSTTGLEMSSSSHVPGISATGKSHVALRITPCPLSNALIAPQLHAMKEPIYPSRGISRLRRAAAGRNCGGSSPTGRWSNNHFRAVVMSAARFAASSDLLFSIFRTGGGRYLHEY